VITFPWPRRSPRAARQGQRAHVVALLDRALEGCLSGEFDAMVTAPVQKSVLNDAASPSPATPNTSPSAPAHPLVS
jgi:4-hydroxy-L-threonine phosphate dehydrogenase PdxA